jgi:hypothetical protein
VSEIKQINGKYLPQQDRLLIRIKTRNEEEYRLFFTRRVTQTVVKAFQEFNLIKVKNSDPRLNTKEIEDFRRDAVQQSITSGGSYASGTHLPLGESPKLICNVKCNSSKKNGLLLYFEMLDKTHLKLVFGMYLINVFLEVLDRLQRKANWGIEIVISSSRRSELVRQASDKSKLH